MITTLTTTPFLKVNTISHLSHDSYLFHISCSKEISIFTQAFPLSLKVTAGLNFIGTSRYPSRQQPNIQNHFQFRWTLK